MSEVRRKPIEIEDEEGIIYTCFTEDHTYRDVIRYLLSTGVDAEELIYHINDPKLLADTEKERMTDQERITKLRDGTWDHTIVRGPNPTGFCFDETLFVQETADRIEQLAATCEELVKERKAMAMRDAGYDVYAGLEAKLTKAEEERDGYLAGRNKFQLYLQRTHADLELEVAAVEALNAKLTECEARLSKAVESIKQSIKLWEKPDGGDRLGKLDNAYDGFELLFKALAELEGKE